MINKITNILVILAIAALLYIFYLIITPVKVMEIERANNLKIITKKVIAGEKVVFEFNYTKYLNLRPDVKKEIICSRSVGVVLAGRQLPAGTHKIYLDHIVPLNMPSDKDCKIYIFLAYHPNFFRTENYALVSEPFEVYNPLYETK